MNFAAWGMQMCQERSRVHTLMIIDSCGAYLTHAPSQSMHTHVAVPERRRIRGRFGRARAGAIWWQSAPCGDDWCFTDGISSNSSSRSVRAAAQLYIWESGATRRTHIFGDSWCALPPPTPLWFSVFWLAKEQTTKANTAIRLIPHPFYTRQGMFYFSCFKTGCN